MGNTIGRPAFEVVLSEVDRSFLEGVIRKTTSPQSHVPRAKIALGAADGLSHLEIMTSSGASGRTVSKWRKRFSLFGVSVLDDAHRSGVPRTHGDEKIAEIINRTLTSEPPNATHWSTTSMAKATGVS